MSCGCNNNGWSGGCGCGNYNTVQYAPSACNPNFPTSCTALGAGTIQRVVGEDSSYCKYTVPTLSSNSILFYNASTAVLSWADGSVGTPIFLGNGSGQATSSSSVQLQATTPTGQLVTFKPTTSTEAQFPVVSPSGTTTNWGTVKSILPNQGIVYKTGATSDGPLAANTVYQLTGTSGQYVSFDASGNPIASTPSITQSYIYKSGNYIATANQSIAADTSAGSWTLTLPPTPANGTVLTVADAKASWGTNNLTISPSSGSTIQGSVQNLICNVSNWQVTLYFNNTSWYVIVT
jgi:hypothetical protein